MDNKKLVDDVASIHLDIQFDKTKGSINLSSIYGSYDYKTDLNIPDGIEAEFYCPYCGSNINSDVQCEECNAHLVPLNIAEGGMVQFCSRSGCKNHNVQFENLSNVLHHFYQNHCYGCTDEPLHVEKKLPTMNVHDEDEEQRISIIESGTFLQTYCPHCEKSLLEDNQVVFKIEKQDGKKGILMLSPYLNVYTNNSTIEIPQGDVAKDIMCPHCDASLIEKGKSCELCGSPVVGISVLALNKLIDFFFCSKKGCPWHGLSDEDITDIVLEDSNEW